MRKSYIVAQMADKKFQELYRRTRRLLGSRTYRKFHRGKSFHKTVYVAGKHVAKRGPAETYREVKRRAAKGSQQHLQFYSDSVYGVSTEEMQNWYTSHARPVSIVIPSYNDYPLLKNCLKTIRAHTDKDQYHVYIVDDYCRPEQQAKLKKLRAQDVTVMLRKENGGFARAVNTGLKKALKDDSKRDVVLVNSDIEAHANWLVGLQHGAYTYHKHVGIVGPKLLYPDGRIQSAGSYRNMVDPIWFEHRYRLLRSDYGLANVPQYCLAVTGACMYLKASTLQKIGIFDEDFPFAFEDNDLCLRAWQQDIRTLYYPASILTHAESATRKQHPTISEREKGSIHYFWKKWGEWLDKRRVTGKAGNIKIIYVTDDTLTENEAQVVIQHLEILTKLDYYVVEFWSAHGYAPSTKSIIRHRSFKNVEDLVQSLEKEQAIKVATSYTTTLPVWLSSIENGIAVNFVQNVDVHRYADDPETPRTIAASYREEFKNFTNSIRVRNDLRSLGLLCDTVISGKKPENMHKQLHKFFSQIAAQPQRSKVEKILRKLR